MIITDQNVGQYLWHTMASGFAAAGARGCGWPGLAGRPSLLQWWFGVVNGLVVFGGGVHGVA